jgi:hypothetical protein
MGVIWKIQYQCALTEKKTQRANARRLEQHTHRSMYLLSPHRVLGYQVLRVGVLLEKIEMHGIPPIQ